MAILKGGEIQAAVEETACPVEAPVRISPGYFG